MTGSAQQAVDDEIGCLRGFDLGVLVGGDVHDVPHERLDPALRQVGAEDAFVDGLEGGFYVRPTLFADVDNSMTIAQEEIFGPVIVVIPYHDEDDAVRMYGLLVRVAILVAVAA